MKILANDGISNSGVKKLESNGFEVITENVSQDNLIDYINTHNINVLLVRSATKVRKDLIDSCNSIKLIGQVINVESRKTRRGDIFFIIEIEVSVNS